MNTSNMAPQPPETSTTAISVAFGNLTLNWSISDFSVGGDVSDDDVENDEFTEKTDDEDGVNRKRDVLQIANRKWFVGNIAFDFSFGLVNVDDP